MLCYKCTNYPTIVWFLSFSSAATAKCHILSRSNGNRSNPPPRPRNPTSQVLRWTTCFRWRKKLHSSTPSPLSRGYTYLNKWKLIHDYLGKAAWIVGSFRIYQKLMISGEDWQNEDILPVNVNFSLLTKTHCSCSKVLAANFLQQPG